MSAFSLTSSPSGDWTNPCGDDSSFFHCPAWQGVLCRAFNCVSHYAWDDGLQDGMALTVFKAGPFRVGYIGFPAGGTLRRAAVTEEMIAALRINAGPELPHLIRVPVSGFGAAVELPYRFSATPETAIQNLSDWRPEALPAAVRRNVRNALRQGVEVVENTDSEVADELHALYCRTIVRRGGVARYNAAYFRQLVTYAIQENRVRCLLARHGDRIAGFMITLHDGTTDYYLHGAMDPALSARRPMDLLFHEAILHARDNGMMCFNMMSSPPGSSLVRFKEKWGGTTVAHKTYAVPIHALYAGLFSIGERLHRMLR